MKLGGGYIRGQAISRIYNKGELVFEKQTPLNPIEFISTVNYQATANSQLGDFTHVAIHEPFYIGQDADTIIPSCLNYFIQQNADSGTGNSYTIVSMCIYKDGDTSVYPVTFSGSESISILNDAFDIQADPVFVNALRGEKWWRKMIISIPASNQRLPFVYEGVDSANAVIGKQFGRYNPADTSVSDTYSVGAFTTTGTAFNNSFNFLWFGGMNMLGNPKVGNKARAFVGDSICCGVGDSPPSILPQGKGFFQRGSNIGSDLNPCHNIGIPGIRTERFNTTSRWRRYLKYCKFSGIMSNTNDTTQGATQQQLQDRISTLASILRSEGIEKIVASKLIALTTGTWTTAGGQTPNPEWLYPGKTYNYNEWMDTQIGTIFDGMISLDLIRDTSPNIWKGQTPTVTNDGIHPNSTGYTIVENQAKSIMDAAFI